MAVTFGRSRRYNRNFHQPRLPGKERLTRLLVLVATLLGVFGSDLSGAQDFPVRAVRLIVPFPPGGPLDIAGRLIGQHLAEAWKQPVIVENRPGGTLGPEATARAAPDGHTLMIISSSPLVTLPHMQRVPYDVLKDLVGITQTTLLTYALVANAESGFQSLADLIAEAKRAPGKINYASAGNGSGQHLLVELFKLAAGIDMTHVPFKGSGPALQAVISNQIPIMLDVTTATVPLARSGKARALFVTGSQPLEAHPGAPPASGTPDLAETAPPAPLLSS